MTTNETASSVLRGLGLFVVAMAMIVVAFVAIFSLFELAAGGGGNEPAGPVATVPATTTTTVVVGGTGGPPLAVACGRESLDADFVVQIDTGSEAETVIVAASVSTTEAVVSHRVVVAVPATGTGTAPLPGSATTDLSASCRVDAVQRGRQITRIGP